MRLTHPQKYSIPVLLLSVKQVRAHGALSIPPSRQWQCSGGATPNNGVSWNGAGGAKICTNSVHGDTINSVITDWSGVAIGSAGGYSTKPYYKTDPRTDHIAAMGGKSSTICNANIPKYDALKDEFWTVEQGDQEFDYKMGLRI